MKLVIDANILISALISPANDTASAIFFGKYELIAPAYIFEEIAKYKKEILSKSKMSATEFEAVLKLLSAQILVFEAVKITSAMIAACPDEKDIAYFALAISEKCAIWSNDKALANQNVVKVYATAQLLKK